MAMQKPLLKNHWFIINALIQWPVNNIYLNKIDYLYAFLSQLEDEQEKIDRLQMELLLENPDSAAFYNAKMRTQRRVSNLGKNLLVSSGCLN